ncbi:alpha/beta fold hydrolase [Microbacteriaceae bacterium VKM Ac-2854]|nr:alpha/beta fold hydrolase [Microbacteriaceae bacterium VKM Ac-2854]
MTRHEAYLRRRAEVLQSVPGGVAGGAGDLVVLLPGFGGLDELEFLAPMLARRHRVLALELPDAPFDEVVAQVRSALPDEPLSIVGFSFGALVALAVGAGAQAVVLGAGWLRPDQRLARFSQLAAAPEFLRFALLSPGSPLDPTFDPRSHLLTADATEHRTTAPTLVLAAEHDALVSREHSELLYGSLEDAAYETLDSGHALLAERPAEVLARIEAFLAAHATTRADA